MILSICIPTYNRISQLDNCLNSILISKKNVDDFNFEICISDNNSEENTKEVIQKYNKELKIKFHRNEIFKKEILYFINAIKNNKKIEKKYSVLNGVRSLEIGLQLKKNFLRM